MINALLTFSIFQILFNILVYLLLFFVNSTFYSFTCDSLTSENPIICIYINKRSNIGHLNKAFP